MKIFVPHGYSNNSNIYKRLKHSELEREKLRQFKELKYYITSYVLKNKPYVDIIKGA